MKEDISNNQESQHQGFLEGRIGRIHVSLDLGSRIISDIKNKERKKNTKEVNNNNNKHNKTIKNIINIHINYNNKININTITSKILRTIKGKNKEGKRRGKERLVHTILRISIQFF